MNRPLPFPPAPDQLPTLIFAPLAWLKLQFFCHLGNTEVGGFGVAAPENPLYIEDFVTVRQEVSAVNVRFNDTAVADYFDSCIDRGLRPDRCGRIWLHTHPGASPMPSGTDEATFDRCFGSCDWAVMFILGRTGLSFARLAIAIGPKVQVHLPVAVDWAAWPAYLAEHAAMWPNLVAAWQGEYQANIVPFAPTPRRLARSVGEPLVEQLDEPPWYDDVSWSPEFDEVYAELAEGVFSHDRNDDNCGA